MARSFATLEVDDPHDTIQSLGEHFPPRPGEVEQFWARTYEAGDWRQYQIDPTAHRTRIAVGVIDGADVRHGLICIAGFKDRAATKFSIKSPGLDFFCLSFLQDGAGELRQPGNGKTVQLDRERAAIFRAQPGAALHTSHGSARLNVWLPAALLRRYGAPLLDGGDLGDIDFEAPIDCRSGAGAGVRRLTEFFFSELARPDSVFETPVSAATAEELVMQSILMSLSHNRSHELNRKSAAAAPGHVRRAEEFIRANAGKAITVESVAGAAGCSVRGLQLAFRRFRNTTPMAALRQARLERAREEILRSDGSLSVIDVASRHGFGHPSRFSETYRQAFGESPSETLRARALARR